MCNSCLGSNNYAWIILLILLFLALTSCGGSCGSVSRESSCGCGCGC